VWNRKYSALFPKNLRYGGTREKEKGGKRGRGQGDRFTRFFSPLHLVRGGTQHGGGRKKGGEKKKKERQETKLHTESGPQHWLKPDKHAAKKGRGEKKRGGERK